MEATLAFIDENSFQYAEEVLSQTSISSIPIPAISVLMQISSPKNGEEQLNKFAYICLKRHVLGRPNFDRRRIIRVNHTELHFLRFFLF